MAYVLEQKEYNFLKSIYDNRTTVTPVFANLPAEYQADVLIMLGTVISNADTLTAIQSLLELPVVDDTVHSTYSLTLPRMSNLSGSDINRIKRSTRKKVFKDFK